MTKSRTGKKAVLIGNGINRLDDTQSISWGDLLEELKKEKDIQNVDLSNDFKPFPLAFEELTHKKPGHADISEKVKILKKTISRIIQKLQKNKQGFNDYHKKIVETNIEHILTTNYEYGFEKGINPDFDHAKSTYALDKTEFKYSLKRGYSIEKNRPKIWHIHGEIEDCRNISRNSKYYKEESILIGYDHYTRYLERIQENISGFSGKQKVDKQSVWTRIKENNSGQYWTDYFFTHDLYIFGFGFDFSENHLWWLLNKRASLINSNSYKKKILIDNKITFLYPYIEKYNRISITANSEELLKKKNSLSKAKAVSAILSAFNVEVEKVICDSFEEFYDKVINDYLD